MEGGDRGCCAAASAIAASSRQAGSYRGPTAPDPAGSGQLISVMTAAQGIGSAPLGPETTQGVDVLVWGGGSGGVAAALQAARSGARTLLLTPGPWLGGMVSAAGVCAPDGNELSPWQSGLWGALLRALAREEPSGLDHNWVSCFGYRPASAERILRRWLEQEPLLQWWPGCRLEQVHLSGDRIEALTLLAGSAQGRQRVPARIVIDGSDRGELIGLSGAPFRLGWEAQELWQEPSAPPAGRLENEVFFRQQPLQSPTWVVLAQWNRQQPLPPQPPALAAPFAAATEAFGLERTLSYGRLPGDVLMLNWPLHGNDWHAGLQRAFGDDLEPGAGAAEAELAADMQAHSLAFLRELERASGGAISAAAVFPDASQAAPAALEGDQPLALMPYWREGRRLVGHSLVLEQHLLPQSAGACRAPLPLDGNGACSAIAVGNYANDHHYPGGDWPLAPKSCRWGGRWSGTPFTIPYGALVSEGLSNLLAADKCLSVSHMANGATRLQPLVLNIGQAAGLAAALCVRLGLDPAELPLRQLQDALISDRQAPAGPLPLWDTPWHHPAWAERQRQALDDPSRLDRHGQLIGADAGRLSPHQAPPEPGERLWQGELRPDGEGGYSLQVEGRLWPLITLEPALHHWLQQQDRPGWAALIGCANPWGPWLRVSRLA